MIVYYDSGKANLMNTTYCHSSEHSLARPGANLMHLSNRSTCHSIRAGVQHPAPQQCCHRLPPRVENQHAVCPYHSLAPSRPWYHRRHDILFMLQVTFAARPLRPPACGSRRNQATVRATNPNVTDGPTLVGHTLSISMRIPVS